MKKLTKPFALVLAALVLVTMGNTQTFAANTDTLGDVASDVTYETKATSSVYGTLTDIKQTGATKSSVSIAWTDKNSAETSWTVEYTVSYNGANIDGGSKVVTQPSFTLKGLDQDSYVYFKVKGNNPYDTYSYSSAYLNSAATIPSKLNSLQANTSSYSALGWNGSKPYNLRISWEMTDASWNCAYHGAKDNVSKNYGVIIKVYDYKGKKLKTYYGDYNGYSYELACAKPGSGYKVTVAPYFKSSGGKVYTGASKTVYAQSQTKYLTKKSEVKKNKFTVRWKKIKNAKSYTVYVGKSSSYRSDLSEVSFKKVTTTKNLKYTVKKLSKKSINTKKYYYYYMVVVNGKIKGSSKLVKSKKYYGGYVHTYY